MAKKKIKYREAEKSDIRRIREWLDSFSLPSIDVDGKAQKIFVAECDGKLVAIGGIEKLGDIALIRSIVVAPEHRKNGIASNIYQLLEKYARNLEIKGLYLITESAKEYFQNLGFNDLERKAAPCLIKQTSQFSKLCPSSATVMVKTLSTRSGK